MHTHLIVATHESIITIKKNIDMGYSHYTMTAPKDI